MQTFLQPGKTTQRHLLSPTPDHVPMQKCPSTVASTVQLQFHNVPPPPNCRRGPSSSVHQLSGGSLAPHLHSGGEDYRAVKVFVPEPLEVGDGAGNGEAEHRQQRQAERHREQRRQPAGDEHALAAPQPREAPAPPPPRASQPRKIGRSGECNTDPEKATQKIKTNTRKHKKNFIKN